MIYLPQAAFFNDIGLFEYSGHKIDQAKGMKLTSQTELNIPVKVSH